jgi:hypothetical protein
MMEKKSCIGDQKLRYWTKWLFSPYFLAFLLIKRKKNYKAKFSTNLILKKKKTNKDNLGRKKTHEKKYCSNWQCFVRKTTVLSPIKSTKTILEKIIKKPFREIL